MIIIFDEHQGVNKYSMLCGAEEACWAHNPKVGGSKPPTATSFANSGGGGLPFVQE